MRRAVWNGAVIAESDATVVVEGNHYFPPDSVNWEYLRTSDTVTACPWKGRAGYFTLVVDGRANRDAAWHYPRPTRAAQGIAGHVAFWRGVRIERAGPAAGRESGESGGLRRLFTRGGAH
jgi:uncharacterized protein (DUF427 family)